MGRVDVSLLLFMLTVWRGSFAHYLKYQTAGGPVQGKLNVHLVSHSHDDVGWLKTVDQYYTGSNNTIQGASVLNVLDSVVDSLLRDSNRKFIFVEQAFFQRWWREQSDKTRENVRHLVHSGQLEFVNGGWCMHDEATTHYIDMIDQTTLGHLKIKEQFNITPRAGWQIDPFGHSAVQAYLLGAEIGFDSLHFARIDYQDRKKRKEDKSLEVIWRGSRTFGSASEIFANAFPVHYSTPDTFNFEVNGDGIPVQDDPCLFDYNVEQRVSDFIAAAQKQANITRANHIMWTMGGDFQYQYAESWYKQMDKLIHYVNKDGQVNAFYSTPSIYTSSKYAANESWPLKTDDYFPYADIPNGYWTGYFTSRPSLKGFIRYLSGYYMATRQLHFFASRNHSSPAIFSLGEALGIAQHHDAVSGTAKQHTTNDYAKRLALGLSKAEKSVNMALSSLTDSSQNAQSANSVARFNQCHLLNISYCPPSENIPKRKSLVVLAYNPLGWVRKDIIRIPVNRNDFSVRDSDGNLVEAQYLEMDNMTANLRHTYAKAYAGISIKRSPKYNLVFQALVPPLGWNTFFLSRGEREISGNRLGRPLYMGSSQSDTVEVGAGNLKMSFALLSGQLKRISNRKTAVEVPVQQGYLWYVSSLGDKDHQASGAYIFRPNASLPKAASQSVHMHVVQGALVDEVHQQFNSWIYQVSRLYKGKDHAEVEFTIGPIPVDDGIGKEVITRLTANMATEKTFYTDSNGRDFIKRVRDFRSDWPLEVHQPAAGNYYPINLGIFMVDKEVELSVLVDRAVGGASIQDGQVELMLHRRMLKDDSRGVGEPLNESLCIENACEGLKIRGKYYVGVQKIGDGSRWRRSVGQEIYSPLVLAFAHEEEEKWRSAHITRSSCIDQGYSLPPNVALITLQDLEDGSVLIRLAHLYEAGEDGEYSAMAEVELKKLFATRRIMEIKEMSLSANQEKSEMKKLKWNIQGEKGVNPVHVRGGNINSKALIVELAPMEIRTFVIKFE